MIRSQTEGDSERREKFLMLGASIWVTLGALEAVADKHPDLHVIHFDAPPTCAPSIWGEELSHSTVLYHAWKLLGTDASTSSASVPAKK